MLRDKMETAICLFEDGGFKEFFPLTYTRPVYDLRCGISTLGEKIAACFPKHRLILNSRRYLQESIKERYPQTPVNQFDFPVILFVNGRLLIDNDSFIRIKKMKENSILLSNDGSVVAAKISENNLKNLVNDNSDLLPFLEMNLDTFKSNIGLTKYSWDLVNLNGSQISNDFDLIVKKTPKIDTKKYPSVVFRNRKKIFVAKDAVLDPFVFIDASDGPVYISKNVHIMSHTFIQGPAYIGNGSQIKKGASIYHNTSIGEVCKVGGEVESSIIQSYSNKQHKGFLGHSYLGSWVNIGADTNNSDLKNNYENISVLLNGKPVNTGSQFVGLIMGDHSKTAINTMFNTGTIVGVSCNIFGSGFPPRYIPSFSWGGSEFIKNYDLNKSLEVAKLVMARRDKNFTPSDENLLKIIFEMTVEERLRKVKS